MDKIEIDIAFDMLSLLAELFERIGYKEFAYQIKMFCQSEGKLKSTNYTDGLINACAKLTKSEQIMVLGYIHHIIEVRESAK